MLWQNYYSTYKIWCCLTGQTPLTQCSKVCKIIKAAKETNMQCKQQSDNMQHDVPDRQTLTQDNRQQDDQAPFSAPFNHQKHWKRCQ